MKQILTSLFILAALHLSAQQSVISQRSTAQGFGITANVGFLSLTWDDSVIDAESGLNLGVAASYGFSERFEAFLQYQVAPSIKFENQISEEFQFSSADLGVRFNFGSTLTNIRPYVDVSYGFTSFTAPVSFVDLNGFFIETDYKASGGHFSFGGGVAYYPSIPFCVKLDIHLSPGVFTEEEFEDYSGPVEIDTDASSLRVNLGGTYRF